jgi:hypothetical protein
MNNPRFPHNVMITRALLDENGSPVTDANAEPVYFTVLESVCGRRQLDRTVDINADILETDYKIAIPKVEVAINQKDSILFTDGYTGETIDGIVSASPLSNFGRNIFFRKDG